ncbi:hypothetical protein JOF56_009196 [Kibdelosporangium banguiense]|uniref:Uncharacterized protein n=1 Tax=Kibdelosporangium banguiense TaxID=1365924 RepID=A0ABS4TXZ7_9PSEU|nr:hypothetical protein [Kibdelosporangium banguiense]
MTSRPSIHGLRPRGRMTGRATATGLPRPDQHLRPASPAPNERPRQGHRDPHAAPPDRSAATATRWHTGAIQSSRPGTTRRSPAPTTTSDIEQTPPAGTPRHHPALAPRTTPPTPRRSIPAKMSRTAPHHRSIRVLVMRLAKETPTLPTMTPRCTVWPTTTATRRGRTDPCHPQRAAGFPRSQGPVDLARHSDARRPHHGISASSKLGLEPAVSDRT